MDKGSLIVNLFAYALIVFLANSAFAEANSVSVERVRIDEQNQSVVIFIHGFTGDPNATWGDFPTLIASDPELGAHDVLVWGYPSHIFRTSPDIDRLGSHFVSRVSLLDQRYRSVVVVSHSMGGLVVRSGIYSADRRDKQAEIQKISHVFLFGTPNEGIGWASLLPNFFSRQVRDMRRNSELIENIRQTCHKIVRANPHQIHDSVVIPTTAIVGLSDYFVPRDSVESCFSDIEVTDGDHSTMVQLSSRDHTSYGLVKRVLMTKKPGKSVVAEQSNFEKPTPQQIPRHVPCPRNKQFCRDLDTNDDDLKVNYYTDKCREYAVSQGWFFVRYQHLNGKPGCWVKV